jgi:hypothetical protein
LHSGLQSPHRTRTQATDPPPDHDHIEPVDHRCQYVDPQRVTVDHHQPLERQPHVGCGADTEVGKAGNTDPCPLARRRRCQCHRKRHRGPTVACHRRTTLQGWQQPDERFMHRQGALTGRDCRQRRKPFSE